jgi:hypothetical protein
VRERIVGAGHAVSERGAHEHDGPVDPEVGETLSFAA